ncbi:urease accessory protein UreF [Jannaschia sp. Os4]|uniref:urease accessory protein UreF n=1 Tax=Jannaschia sp. Os4 TaxID=2807617 RepID=UPI00193A4A74|nr:urease accessory UreF family protein [Jannaschia sp. Os4]MBM2577728.1 urease accessory protein UreF [Jannaschia sp. Os4]
MTTTTDLLRLAQWTGAGFPTSAYAYSHGLETAMAEGRVTDAAGVEAWTRDVLTRGTGPLDAWAIRGVMGGADPSTTGAFLQARAGAPERWAEARDMGTAFAATLGAEAHPLPVALGLAARGMDPETVVALHLQSLAAQIVQAAARFLPLGQSEAQAILAALHDAIAAEAARRHDEPPGQGAWLAEMDALAHEGLQPRIFRT